MSISLSNKFLLGFFSLFLLAASCFAQAGCQDPLATNFNPSATQTDSSCLYPTTNWSHTSRIAGLATVLDESSSLLLTDKRLFSNTDGGNPNHLYEIDSLTGQLKKTTTIWNFNNVDWEELAADSHFIYVGDFGNNDGDRTNLRVLRVKKTEVYHPDSLSIRADAIRFFYPNQTNFSSSNTHNFDCEAFFYHQNKLHLFSKNRGNLKTTYYQVGCEPTLFPTSAPPLDSLDVGGLITGAAIRADGKVVALLGYNPQSLQVFVWILFGYPSNKFFSGNRRRIDLPSATSSGQMEGICFVDDYRLWISNEKLGLVPARVRQINIRNLIQPFFTPSNPIVKPTIKISKLAKNERSGIEIKSTEPAQLYLFDQNGRKTFHQSIRAGNTEIQMSGLVTGLYFVQLVSENGFVLAREKFVIH